MKGKQNTPVPDKLTVDFIERAVWDYDIGSLSHFFCIIYYNFPNGQQQCVMTAVNPEICDKLAFMDQFQTHRTRDGQMYLWYGKGNMQIWIMDPVGVKEAINELTRQSKAAAGKTEIG